MDILPNEDLLEGLKRKAEFKQEIFNITKDTFQIFKDCFKEIEKNFNEKYPDSTAVEIKYSESNEFEAKIKFGSDVIFLIMHTNIFEFSRMHEIMQTPYIVEDKNRSYCGVIMMYNFLSDSLKYNRTNDFGYLVGRIFINSEKHYFIEGKKEIGQLYNNFSTSVITPENVKEICESAIRYTVNFDLLMPPFEALKIVSVADVLDLNSNIKMATGKRLGYRFQADAD